jgi:hypothetical protein
MLAIGKSVSLGKIIAVVSFVHFLQRISIRTNCGDKSRKGYGVSEIHNEYK